MRKNKVSRQERLAFEYEAKEDDASVTAYGGLPLVLETMRALGLSEAVASNVEIRERESEFDEAKMVEALVLLMATGGDCMDDIRMLREDKALCRLLGMNFPSPETVRKFLYEFHDESLIELAAEIAERNKQVVIPRQSR